MAVIYELWTEGGDERETGALARYLASLTFTLISGRRVAWRADVGGYSAPGVAVWSTDLPQGYCRHVQDAVDLTESGLRLLHALKAGPSFRFAHVGWEAGLITTAEVSDHLSPLETGGVVLSLECILSEQLYRQLGEPRHFQPFA